MAINFFSEGVTFNLKGKNKYKRLLKVLCEQHGKRVGDVNYIFCNDEYLHKINVEYLNHDNLTDIITFDYVEGVCISGDIYVSIERVRANAKDFMVEVDDEITRVVSHGFLHLLGYKDKKPVDKKLMTEKEDLAIALFKEME